MHRFPKWSAQFRAKEKGSALLFLKTPTIYGNTAAARPFSARVALSLSIREESPFTRKKRTARADRHVAPYEASTSDLLRCINKKSHAERSPTLIYFRPPFIVSGPRLSLSSTFTRLSDRGTLPFRQKSGFLSLLCF